MFSMARNCSRADIFSLTPLKNCPSYSWQENVTRKIIISSNRVACKKLCPLQKHLNTFPNPQTIFGSLELWNWFYVFQRQYPGRRITRKSRKFRLKIAGIESHEHSKIKILREFEVAKCFKGGEIFLNNSFN